jgi:[ribosomal protein S18]-alanine N-acetyltransferase
MKITEKSGVYMEIHEHFSLKAAQDQECCERLSLEGGPQVKRIPIIVKLYKESCQYLHAIELLSSTIPWSVRLFEDEFLTSYSRIYGARKHGRLSGFIVVHTLFNELHIVNFAVHPNMRNQGIGSALLKKVFDVAEEEGIARVTLEVRKSNEKANALYHSFGFQAVGSRPRYYADNGEDALILTAVIPSLRTDSLSSSNTSCNYTKR